MNLLRLKQIFRNNKTVFQNFTYMGVLQVFLLIAPLITYPYLVKVFGKELYGIIISAQVLVSYCSIVIDFGSNTIAARFISLSRGDKSEVSKVLSAILSARFYLLIICLLAYIAIVSFVSSFAMYKSLFILMYGMTFNDLLFPQFFFQGMERMKYITLINIFIKILFILLIFIFVRYSGDYLLVPIFYTCGYFIGGLFSLYLIYKSYDIFIKLVSPRKVFHYVKECSPILAKELISTIKDKLNFFLVGKYIGMSEVVVYDLSFKLVSILSKPVYILGTVLLPRFARNSNKNRQNQALVLSVTVSTLLVIITNFFLQEIVVFFLNEEVELFPIRVILIAPILISVSSCIGFNFMLAKGFNKHVLGSIAAATSTYIICMLVVLFVFNVPSLISFIMVSIISYSIEFLYRLSFFLKNNK